LNGTRGELLASSELAWVEISRALLRAGVVDVEAELAKACAGIAQQRLDARIVTVARTIGSSTLRSVDAIHLAAAGRMWPARWGYLTDAPRSTGRAMPVT
jgi:predicted nucleic acid-binding protein